MIMRICVTLAELDFVTVDEPLVTREISTCLNNVLMSQALAHSE